MKLQVTTYGPRWYCNVEGCEYACWGGATSTPADKRTRWLRREAHKVFDELWVGFDGDKKVARTALYLLLASYMKLPLHQTHIGKFSADECEKVLEFCKIVTLQDVLQAAAHGRKTLGRDTRNASDDDDSQAPSNAT